MTSFWEIYTFFLFCYIKGYLSLKMIKRYRFPNMSLAVHTAQYITFLLLEEYRSWGKSVIQLHEFKPPYVPTCVFLSPCTAKRILGILLHKWFYPIMVIVAWRRDIWAMLGSNVQLESFGCVFIRNFRLSIQFSKWTNFSYILGMEVAEFPAPKLHKQNGF